jgi:Tfp pilus assembly protein PilO
MKSAATGRRATRRFDLRDDLWTIVAVLGGLLALNLAFYLLFNLPRLTALQNLAQAGAEASRGLKTAARRIADMKELVGGYDDATRRLDEFYTSLLSTQAERMITIQKEIRAIATEFRIDPESIDYTSEDKGGLTRFQIAIPMVGGYPNLRQFINRVENSPHLLIVDAVELTGSREGGAMLSLTIRMSTYFRSPGNVPVPAAGGESPA